MGDWALPALAAARPGVPAAGEDRFAREIVRELRDFMDANPVGTAVNWACTMDVALRAVNWAVALELIRPCTLPPEVWLEAYQALFDHGGFIERHLENHYEVTSNHFLSNVVGLFYVASVFRDLPRGQLWDRSAARGSSARSTSRCCRTALTTNRPSRIIAS